MIIVLVKYECKENCAKTFLDEISQDDFNFLSCVPNTFWAGEHPDLVIPTVKSDFDQ